MSNWIIAPGQFESLPPQDADPLDKLVEDAGYMLRCGPSFGPGTIHHALASAVLLIADLTERLEVLESHQRYAAARVGSK
jgi:hypothetical protein